MFRTVGYNPRMQLSPQQVNDFGIALNEATLVGVEVEAQERWASLTFAVLALPEDDGPAPEDPRVQLIVSPVGRIAASLRHGNWDDAGAAVEPFGLERLAEVVAGFEQQPVYGWEFLDVPEERNFADWATRLSLDWVTAPGGTSHTLDLFQEWSASRHLDVRLWFDELRLFGADRREIPLDDFTASGVRWWKAFRAGDPRTAGHGMVTLAPDHAGDAT
jgi:hypothetical protein